VKVGLDYAAITSFKEQAANGKWVDACACGERWPCPDAVDPGSSYDTGPGACIGVHAEVNALLQVSDRSRLKKATLYITEAPCDGCLKIIKNTAISRIVWPTGEFLK
jgi:deoxycytidylate deaminase